jgi:hypothetical protein
MSFQHRCSCSPVPWHSPRPPSLRTGQLPWTKLRFISRFFPMTHLILLNVNIPPGRNTGYHIHYADSVSVNLTPASQTNQNYGSSEVSAPGSGGEGAPGRTTFTNVTKDGPRTHKATNVGPTPFHNISFILKNRDPSEPMVSNRSGIAGYTQIMDNAHTSLAGRSETRRGNWADHANSTGTEGLHSWRRIGRNGAGIGRSWHGSV